MGVKEVGVKSGVRKVGGAWDAEGGGGLGR